MMLGIRIYQHCPFPGYEAYAKVVSGAEEEDPLAINIAWVNLDSSGLSPNHVVPLVNCKDGKFSISFLPDELMNKHTQHNYS